jgi:hypothetical protein
VVFYPAPGITNQDFATEQIAGAIVQLKARYALNVALQEIGAEQYGGDGAGRRKRGASASVAAFRYLSNKQHFGSPIK